MNPETLSQRDCDFQSEVLYALTHLRMIAEGTVPRGNRKHRWEETPGNRPMRMPDAKAKAKLTSERLNVAVQKFIQTAPRNRDWQEYRATVRKTIEVHPEPDDLGKPLESCTDCQKPTRYWMEDRHTPLCQSCCAVRNQHALNPTPEKSA